MLTRGKPGAGSGSVKSADQYIHIGLVNNMPDGALEATERQFRTLLGKAANGVPVRLSLYALPDVPRTEAGRRHLGRFYFGIGELWNSQLDGLIVTGADPQAPQITDEPYWGSLTRVFDWAEHNTRSTVFSCLAAHGAVQHIDGIGRRRLRDKRFGVFPCARVSDHPLVAGTPSLFQIPHSRWNDLPVDALADCGYKVLTRTKDGDVDAFVKQRKSLFVFFQGHPEYESNTLLLEYRREVGRYLRKERETYPAVPEDYLDPEMGDVLAALRQRALSDRNGDLLKDLRAGQIEERIMNTWFPVAATIYGNWLAFLSAQKKRRLTKIPIGKHLHNTQKTDLPLSLAPAETRNLRTKHDPGGLT